MFISAVPKIQSQEIRDMEIQNIHEVFFRSAWKFFTFLFRSSGKFKFEYFSAMAIYKFFSNEEVTRGARLVNMNENVKKIKMKFWISKKKGFKSNSWVSSDFVVECCEFLFHRLVYGAILHAVGGWFAQFNKFSQLALSNRERMIYVAFDGTGNDHR